MLHNYVTMHSKKKTWEWKPHLHREYLQPLVRRKQAKIQLFTGSQPKQCRESKQFKAQMTCCAGRHMSFNRTQSRVVTGLLTGHNILRRHLHLWGQLDDLMCRGWGVKGETSAHILCQCEALASLKRTYLGSFFLEPEDILWCSGRPA
jgi:hypothetical protein